MNGWKLLACAIVTISVGANAQTPGCVTVDDQLICPRERSNSSSENAFNESHFRSEVERARTALIQREAIKQERTRTQQSLKESVGGLIADGNCTGAYDAALRAGDLELASQVKEVCAAR